MGFGGFGKGGLGGFGKGMGKGLGLGWGKGWGKGPAVVAEAAVATAVVASVVARPRCRGPPRAEVIVIGADDVTVVSSPRHHPHPPRPHRAAAVAGGAVAGAILAGPIGPIGAVVGGALGAVARAPLPPPPHPETVVLRRDAPTPPARLSEARLEGQVLEVVIPAGIFAGQSLAVTVPDGAQHLVELPEGYPEGSTLQVWFEPEMSTLTPLA